MNFLKKITFLKCHLFYYGCRSAYSRTASFIRGQSFCTFARAVTRYVGRGVRGTWVEPFELRGSSVSRYVPRQFPAVPSAPAHQHLNAHSCCIRQLLFRHCLHTLFSFLPPSDSSFLSPFLPLGARGSLYLYDFSRTAYMRARYARAYQNTVTPVSPVTPAARSEGKVSDSYSGLASYASWPSSPASAASS